MLRATGRMRRWANPLYSVHVGMTTFTQPGHAVAKQSRGPMSSHCSGLLGPLGPLGPSGPSGPSRPTKEEAINLMQSCPWEIEGWEAVDTRQPLVDNPRQARSKICPTSLPKLSRAHTHERSHPTTPSKSHQHGRLPKLGVHIPPARPLLGRKPLEETLQTGALAMLATPANRFKLDISQYCCVRVCVCLLAYSSFYLAICLPIHPRRSLCIYSATCLFDCLSVHFPTCLFDPICSGLIQSSLMHLPICVSSYLF